MTITREIRSPSRLANPNRFDLGRLAAAERLFVWRHRQPATNGRAFGRNGSAMNQAEAASQLGLDRALYGRLENGQRTRLSVEEIESLSNALGALTPTPGELCLLARRRSGMLLMTIERDLKVSRPRFHELERAGDPTIVRYWEGQGFRFPLSLEFTLA